MFGGRSLCALGMVFVPLFALPGPSHAWGLVISDSKAQALAHYIVGVCDDINGETAQAIREYQKSVKLDGSQPAPRLKLGAYYLRLDDFKQATAQLKTVVRLAPQQTEAHYLLALIYSSEHKYDLAAREYETILKATAQNDPSSTQAIMYLGKLYFSEGKYPQAIEQFLTVVRLDSANTSALYLLGSVYADIHDNTKAIELLRKVLEREPDNSEALNSLGYVYAEQGIHLDEAVRMVRRALEIDPANGAYYDSLGWALYKKQMYAESLVVLQKAQQYIEDEILYDHIGDVYKALKAYTRAIEYWRKSLDMDPHRFEVQQKIKTLEKWIASKSSHQLN
jgi:tetratricopeptide (TPR) repeat protein